MNESAPSWPVARRGSRCAIGSRLCLGQIRDWLRISLPMPSKELASRSSSSTPRRANRCSRFQRWFMRSIGWATSPAALSWWQGWVPSACALSDWCSSAARESWGSIPSSGAAPFRSSQGRTRFLSCAPGRAVAPRVPRRLASRRHLRRSRGAAGTQHQPVSVSGQILWPGSGAAAATGVNLSRRLDALVQARRHPPEA
jgi:hypothetical protein